jgi:hypothetical protein
MKTLRRFFVRLTASIARGRDERRLRDEIEEHLALQTAENIQAGLSPGEARRQAVLKFGAVEAIKEDYRDNHGMAFLEHLLQDVRYAMRGLHRNPGFTIVAVLTLALGIGLTTAVFSVMNAVLLNPLPYVDGERIVLVREILRDRGNASVGHFLDWSGDNTVFEHIAAAQPTTYNLADGGAPERVRGTRVTPATSRLHTCRPPLAATLPAGMSKRMNVSSC